MDVRTEVENILAGMRAAATTLEVIRETIEIQAIARQCLMPEVEDRMCRPVARAIVLGAVVQRSRDVSCGTKVPSLR